MFKPICALGKPARVYCLPSARNAPIVPNGSKRAATSCWGYLVSIFLVKMSVLKFLVKMSVEVLRTYQKTYLYFGSLCQTKKYTWVINLPRSTSARFSLIRNLRVPKCLGPWGSAQHLPPEAHPSEISPGRDFQILGREWRGAPRAMSAMAQKQLSNFYK